MIAATISPQNHRRSPGTRHTRNKTPRRRDRGSSAGGMRRRVIAATGDNPRGSGRIACRRRRPRLSTRQARPWPCRGCPRRSCRRRRPWRRNRSLSSQIVGEARLSPPVFEFSGNRPGSLFAVSAHCSKAGIDQLGVERPLPAHHLHHRFGVVVVLLHQVFARLDRIRLRHGHRHSNSGDGERGNHECR